MKRQEQIPEKIYVHKSQYWGLMANEHNITKDGIEYTRTDAFESKEVDLEKEIQNELSKYSFDEKVGGMRKDGCIYVISDYSKIIAKHFLELGIKTQIMTPKLQQRIGVLKMEFWTGLQTFEETEMTLSDAYNQGVDDVLEELGLKAQKGEEV